ncbi:CopG family transcriptional regulator [Microbacterium sp. M1A1_1b]|uniref:CopG family transcriptional regulator n=1 Tax=Curtobacterium sp. VKM Ac-2922 TaxID=2929475 RepID=UPI001FB4BD73|nr:CopG family transcriptional regulator [Curtobacterium sp. VKM Ac-2922]MCJ1715187.1 CopG family transcriptional regulator [Curtobacterium sp. VKM Ac-2922]
MKKAISVPDADFERFERVARAHGMNRSEFYRTAAARFADQLEGTSELTALADAALAKARDDDDLFVRQNERLRSEGTTW